MPLFLDRLLVPITDFRDKSGGAGALRFTLRG